jgi:UDP-N-acetylmuramoylalanine--D-glutamate ligase
MTEALDASVQAPLTLIVGLGETGLASARWCLRQGDRLRVVDTRAEPGGLDALRADEASVEFVLGDDALLADAAEPMLDPRLLDGVARLVISPGLAPQRAPAKALVEAATAAGIPVVGEIELFAQALVALRTDTGYAPRVLAVTGTNGKTTVTAMTAQLVEASGLSVRAAGNISPAALTALMEAIDAQALPQVWVLELSSFQLETTRTLAVDAAVVLNLTQDHLDWHDTMVDYAAAKARLLTAARVAIVNRDDPAVLRMVEKLEDLGVRSFGQDLPVLEGDMGVDHGHGVAWLAESADRGFDAEPVKRKKNEIILRGAGRLNRLMPADALQIRGGHNVLNAQAALMLARAIDLSWPSLLRALRAYRGEPHRVEFLRNITGVDFIDDSKGTNVGATVAALEGLGQRVVLIAGGVGKGQDFSPLVRPVALHARAVLLIGRDGPEIGEALADTGVPCITVDSLPAAVVASLDYAQEGDAVLLSPACASFDMFRSYAHRAQVFADAVTELANDKGQV